MLKKLETHADIEMVTDEFRFDFSHLSNLHTNIEKNAFLSYFDFKNNLKGLNDKTSYTKFTSYLHF